MLIRYLRKNKRDLLITLLTSLVVFLVYSAYLGLVGIPATQKYLQQQELEQTRQRKINVID
jgi:cell division protein FtsB